MQDPASARPYPYESARFPEKRRKSLHELVVATLSASVAFSLLDVRYCVLITSMYRFGMSNFPAACFGSWLIPQINKANQPCVLNLGNSSFSFSFSPFWWLAYTC